MGSNASHATGGFEAPANSDSVNAAREGPPTNEESHVTNVRISRYHKKGARNLTDDYQVGKQVLGKGWNGAVLLVRGKIDGRKYALKRLQVSGLESRGKLATEVDVYLAVDHPNIARLVDVYEMERETCLIMECCNGGELYDRLAQKTKYSEHYAADVTKQMLRAVAYLHTHNIVHRDLKLENWLYESEEEDALLKLIDFGFAKMTKTDTPMLACCGSLYYVSPEVLLRNGYDNKCDIWSLGVIVFMLLTGCPPFDGDAPTTKELIKNGDVGWKHLSRTRASPSAVEFIKWLLTKDPATRPSAKDALDHPWVLRNAHQEAIPCFSPDVLSSLKAYRASSSVRRAVLQLLAQELTSDETRELRELFLQMDSDNKGTVSLKELKETIRGQREIKTTAASKNAGLGSLVGATKRGSSKKAPQLASTVINDLFSVLDTNGENEIFFSDFLAATMEVQKNLRDESLQKIFHRLDNDGSGSISTRDLQSALGEGVLHGNKQAILEDFDGAGFDCNGEMTYDSFVRLVTPAVG